MIGALPEHLTVGNTDYSIRSDYRNVLQIFEAFNDHELEKWEKWVVAIFLLFENFSCADDVIEAAENGFDVDEAIEKIKWFISAGNQQEKEEQPIYDWKQDEQIIFSAINDKSKCVEVREEEYIHWWTFLGYFNEIDRNSIFSFIMSIRSKRNKGKKLEKYEQEFYKKNKELVDIKPHLTKEEHEQEAEYKALLDEVLG